MVFHNSPPDWAGFILYTKHETLAWWKKRAGRSVGHLPAKRVYCMV